MLMGYCFVVLGIFFGLNAQTVLMDFGGAWMAIFLILHAVFVGVIIHDYLQRDVILSSRLTTIVEMLYLTLVGIFSMITLFILQAGVEYMAYFDPRYTISKMFIPMSLQNSTLTSSQDSVIVSQANYLIIVIILYFAVLLALYYFRKVVQNRESFDSQRYEE